MNRGYSQNYTIPFASFISNLSDKYKWAYHAVDHPEIILNFGIICAKLADFINPLRGLKFVSLLSLNLMQFNSVLLDTIIFYQGELLILLIEMVLLSEMFTTTSTRACGLSLVS